MSNPNAHHLTAKTRHSLLQSRTSAFCAAFLDLPDNPPEKLLNEHFTPSNPKITEHGPSWASTRLPFLGKTFTGREDCLTYFALLSDTLEFIPNANTFPGAEEIVVDDHVAVTSVVGKAIFKAVATGKQWEEQFIWRLSELDEEGRIGHWEIWADPLSAWVAVSKDEGAIGAVK